MQRVLARLSLMMELAAHEIRVQRRETFLGLVWLALWPALQAGGFMLAFSMIRGADILDRALIVYLGILAWSSVAMLVTSSASFFVRNAEMVRHLAFPLHLILLNEIHIKFVFIIVQLLIASGIYIAIHGGFSLTAIMNLALFIVSLYLLVVALSSFASFLGAVLPDLPVALPLLLVILLVLSPIFHTDPAQLPVAVNYLNQWNPLSQVVIALYGCLGVGGPQQLPIKLFFASLASFGLAQLFVRRAYQELAKVV